MNEVARARFYKAEDNTKCSVIDCLYAVIADIESGDLPCDGLLVLTRHAPEDERKPFFYDTYRVGMTREQEITTLVLAQERTIRNWIDDS